MCAKTWAVAFIAIWLFNASLAAPAPEPEPEAQPDPCGCGNGCSHGCGGGRGNNCGSGGCVTKVQTVPLRSHIPIKTTHKILSDHGCGGDWNGGCGGWGGYGGWGGCGGSWDGWGLASWDGCGGWGNGWDSGCDCVVTRIHHVPVTTHIPIKTTHRVSQHGDWGSNGGWTGYGNGCGCGCGCNGWW